MPVAKKQEAQAAARVLKEMLLLGKNRKYGDLLDSDELSRIPGPGLRAMVDAREIELLGDLEASSPGREIAMMRTELTALRRRVEALESKET